MGIAENIIQIENELKKGVRLVAVSKTKTTDEIMEAYQAGQRVFGENKVQELVSKYEKLPRDIEWHFIGHLQTNKVKYLAPFVSLIHGVDSLKLLQSIHKEALKNKRVIPCLLQFHIAEEETKFGLDLAEAEVLLASPVFAGLNGVEIRGVMGMATFTEDETQVRKEFQILREIFCFLRDKYFQDKKSFSEISMGMSGDYLWAMEEGSTLIRVGSKIFGERAYQ